MTFQMADYNTVLPPDDTPNVPEDVEKDENRQFLEQTLKKMGLPPPAHNGGWYNGEPFHPSIAPQPIIPDAGYITHYARRNCDPKPHPATFFHYPGGGYRPGNYHPILPGIDWYENGKLGILCNPGCFKHVPDNDCRVTKNIGDGSVQYTYIQ